MNNLFLFKWFFLIFYGFPYVFVYGELQNNLYLNSSLYSNFVNESDLPIFGEKKVISDSKEKVKSASLFGISDLVKLFLFLVVSLFCMLLFKAVLLKKKKIRSDKNSNFIKELVCYDLDAKNSIKIISILGNVYILLVSNNFSFLLKEIQSREELESLKFELSKVDNVISEDSFKSIFNKILHNKTIPSFCYENDSTALEKDIENSLKDKQDRLKKF